MRICRPSSEMAHAPIPVTANAARMGGVMAMSSIQSLLCTWGPASRKAPWMARRVWVVLSKTRLSSVFMVMRMMDLI